jgi:hypothetical protein
MRSGSGLDLIEEEFLALSQYQSADTNFYTVFVLCVYINPKHYETINSQPS